MFRKLNIRTLIIILLVLVAIWLISDFVGNNDRSFRSTVVEVDTANVTDIFIKMPDQSAKLHLSRTGAGEWKVSAGDQTYPADQNVVKNILSQFNEMKPERVAATSRDKWKQYEVTDSTGTHVTLLNNGNDLADIYIGKFSYSQPAQTQMQNPYQQQRGKMTSFVRVADESKVFAVDGFLKMTYQKDVNAYRNKSLVDVNKDDISRMVFNYPELQFTMNKEDNAWMIDGVPADSAKTAKYINAIARLNSSAFVDPSTPKTSDATNKVRIEGNNFKPVELKAYPSSDTLVKYVVTSSVNPGAEFNGSKAKLYEKVFVDKSAFLPEMQ